MSESFTKAYSQGQARSKKDLESDQDEYLPDRTNEIRERLEELDCEFRLAVLSLPSSEQMTARKKEVSETVQKFAAALGYNDAHPKPDVKELLDKITVIRETNKLLKSRLAEIKEERDSHASRAERLSQSLSECLSARLSAINDWMESNERRIRRKEEKS